MEVPWESVALPARHVLVYFPPSHEGSQAMGHLGGSTLVITASSTLSYTHHITAPPPPPITTAPKNLGTRSFWLVLIRVWVTIHKTISDLWLCLSVSDDTAIRPCNTPPTPPVFHTTHPVLSPNLWTTPLHDSSPCSRFFSRFCLHTTRLQPPPRRVIYPSLRLQHPPAIPRHLVFPLQYPSQRRASLPHSNRRCRPSVRPSGAYSESFMRGSRQKKNKKKWGGTYDKKRRKEKGEEEPSFIMGGGGG